ncbi:MAG TPA: DNA translocase FtsK 4TM domain-containing protein, partial [Gemmatimonadaceae bacterium]|nr:DNA translocase FtsK 4TM domain-containing protein [Gemmatimonadaceae bacterium]
MAPWTGIAFYPCTRSGRSPRSVRSGGVSDVASAHLRRELGGIAMMLFAVFLAGALGVLALAELRSGIDVRGSVGWVGWYLARPLVLLVGWPAAALTPLAAAAHALRLFERLGPTDDRDRSHGPAWMVFFGGLALLLPIAAGLILGLRLGSDYSSAAGLWGGLVAAYWREWFGAMGAWVVVTLALSGLTAATLAWNPIRMIIGRRAAPPTLLAVDAVDASAPTRRRRRKAGDVATENGALALALEPPPEEMPAADPTLVADGRIDGGRHRKRKAKADAATERDEEIAAAIEASGRSPDVLGDDLPPSDLLTQAPQRNVDAGRRELDAMGAKLVDALRTFRVEGELVGRTTGPVVTQYEIEPAPGVKVRQFATLAND